MLAAERIKLFSTRSPWWGSLLALAITMGFAAIMVTTVEDTSLISVGMAEFGYDFGLAVVTVLAALSVTTEYRFNRIRTTFPAHPHRGPALPTKTTVLALLLGEHAGPPLSTSELSWPWALGYFAAFGLVMLAVAIVTTRRRDA